MKKIIQKSLRFSSEEFSKIDDELKKLNISFSDFARGILLKQKIKLPIKIELVYQLNLIQIQLEKVSKNLPNTDRLKILTLLVSIENKLQKLI